jgi:asparagine synthase (glutamine-hydrolysing)
MSAIFGIIDFTGRPIAQEWIRSMQTDLAHRGPDGEGLYQEPGVALGHKLLQVTPESIYDRSPYEEHGFVITANARLDQREAIMDRLGIPSSEREIITDPLLLLRSFRKFGKDFLKDIYGDFAFAIWDQRKKELFCARDQIGIKPFVYYHQDGRFVFSTETKALVRLPIVKTEIDFFLMRDNSMGFEDTPNDPEWKNIFYLNSAHFLNINPKNIVIRRYWDLEYKENNLYKTEQQTALALKELLTKVIDDHSRVIGQVGVPLSGGLDSSTITCIAARKFTKENKNIVTASSVLDPNVDVGRLKDEKEFIDEVLKQEPNIEPTFVYHSEMNFLNGLEEKFEKHYSRVGPLYYNDEALNKQFQKKSVRRVLSGVLGDATTSNSTILPLPYLLAQGKIKTFLNLSRKYRENMNLPLFHHVVRNIIQPLIPFFLLDSLYFILGKRSPWDISDLPIPLSISSKEKAVMKKRMKSSYKKFYFDVIFDFGKNIWRTDYEVFDEEWDCGPAHFQLEYTYPLLDRRLIEFLVQVPVAHFYAGGLNRGLIREAMKGTLPEKIRLRRSKISYSPADGLICDRELDRIKIWLKDEPLEYLSKEILNINTLISSITLIQETKKEKKFPSNYWRIIVLILSLKYLEFENKIIYEKELDKS